jgi:hypothetical protein
MENIDEKITALKNELFVLEQMKKDAEANNIISIKCKKNLLFETEEIFNIYECNLNKLDFIKMFKKYNVILIERNIKL